MRATSRTVTCFSDRCGNSLKPVSGSLRVAIAFSRAARVSATLFWITPRDKRFVRAAGRLDLLKQGPGRAAEFVGQRLDAAGAGGRIGDFGEIGFFLENELRVARDAARERVRQSERIG